MKKLLLIILTFPVFILIGCVPDTGTDSPFSRETGEHIDSTGDLPPDPVVTPGPSLLPEATPEQTPEQEPEPMPANPPSFGFIDAHADTILRALHDKPVMEQSIYEENLYRIYDNDVLHVDFKRLLEFDAPVQVFAAWLPEAFIPAAFDSTNIMFDFFEREVEKHSDIIEIALDLNDIVRIAGEGKISALLAIEGGEALEGKIENLDHFYNRGVRILGLTWNRENELGYGHATGSLQGLKPFGMECVKRMDELGMIIDVSHLNEAGFRDVHNTGTRPYMASHSNAYTVLQHTRNLKDDQIKAIVESGGIIGFNMYPPFITQNRSAVMDDVYDHLRHFIQIGAGNHIGLGCDFDGITSMPEGIDGVQSLKWLGETLADVFDEETSYKIMEGNFYEFFKRYFEG